MELDNTEAIKKLVEAGFGASILPQEALRKCPLIRTFQNPRRTPLPGSRTGYSSKRLSP